MHLNVFVCTLLLSIRTGFKPTRTKPNRNINDLVFELSIRFGFEPKTDIKPNGLVETPNHFET
jgi:hypothetical protein